MLNSRVKTKDLAEETCSSATSSTTHLRWIHPELNARPMRWDASAPRHHGPLLIIWARVFPFPLFMFSADCAFDWATLTEEANLWRLPSWVDQRPIVTRRYFTSCARISETSTVYIAAGLALTSASEHSQCSRTLPLTSSKHRNMFFDRIAKGIHLFTSKPCGNKLLYLFLSS
jgi:hypothetical protein